MSKKSNKKVTLAKVIIIFFLALGSGYCLFEMFMIMDADTLEYLAHNECSNDYILNQSFVDMD
jgi:hypothetical protein